MEESVKVKKILVKFPTRQRPDQFLRTLESWIDRQSNDDNVFYLVSYDKDDESMTPEIIAAAKRMAINISLISGYSQSKIEACNRDIDVFSHESDFDWDVVVLVSDDMFCVLEDWDEQIRKDMPDTLDHALWYHDGSTQKRITTLSIMGRELYKELGCNLYHPAYISTHCDNEFTEVCQNKGVLKELHHITIANHNHYIWGQGVPKDELYERNDKFWHKDQETLTNRRLNGFPL